MVEEPGIWRIAPVRSNDGKGFKAQFPHFISQEMSLGSGNITAARRGVKPNAPKHFVRHPITDSRKTSLVEKKGFDDRLGVASKVSSDPVTAELW